MRPRAATRNRLIGELRMTDETADAWIAAWEAQAAQDGLERGATYWDAGWRWIASSDGAGCGLDPGAYGAGMEDEERQRRLDRVGHAIRIELAIGFLAPVVVTFLYVAAPGGSRPMFEPLWVTLLPWIGVAGVPIGLAWLVRLSRLNPERGEVDWRYRDF